VSEDAVLQGGKRVFDDGASPPHGVWGGALLHAPQSMVVQMPRNPPPRCRGATSFERAYATPRRFRCIHHTTILARELPARQRLLGWAAEGISPLVIVEQSSVEQRAIPFVVDGALGRNIRQDASGFPGLGLLTVGVTGIGEHVHSGRIAHCLLRGLGHRQQAALIVGFGCDLLRHD